MDAVVLAAGEGTRLRPLTEDKPKGMVEVAGEPILTHCFSSMRHRISQQHLIERDSDFGSIATEIGTLSNVSLVK